MIVEVNTPNSCTVTINKEIKVGQYFRISPSEGYAGVDSGVIKVSNLITPEYLEYVSQEEVELIESYKQVHLDMFTDREEVRQEPEYSQELRRLDNTVWVMYQYPYDGDKQLWVFPIEEFVEHISIF